MSSVIPASFNSGPHRGRGAALFISLMFLIVLTLIGLSAANVGIMQERMAGNVRETNIAFQQAEAVLRATEARVPQFISSGGGIQNVESMRDIQTAAGTNRSDCALETVAADQSFDSVLTWTDSPDVSDGRYAVALLGGDVVGGLPIGTSCGPIDGQADGKPIDSQRFFMVMGRAPGPAGRADTIVQSIYFWPAF